MIKINKIILIAACFGMMSSCTILPRSGPNKYEVTASARGENPTAHIVPVTPEVVYETKVPTSSGFTKSFLQTKPLNAELIRPGDTLNLTVWENVEDGLLSSGMASAATLSELQVDGSGHIFVPYAGRIKVAGQTPEEIRHIVTQALQDQTPDPQVEVRRSAGAGATVSIIGSVGGQGIYPILHQTRTLSTMLASSGGLDVKPELVRVTVIRGKLRSEVWLDDLYDRPELDIALRDGDRILIEADRRSFVIMGAAGRQSQVAFDQREISALEALSRAGGLSAYQADPKGVFVLRKEDQSIARRVVGDAEIKGEQHLIYVLNLTEPDALFLARDFTIRDQDTVYITEAPLSTWNKTLRGIMGGLSTTTSFANTISDLRDL
ncbi:polysaccharide biosynthesis/export family protein [Planktomarina temperata]|uniref:polysaccharide biosynthesis/export family protein n=1 Tax=Planktomarina temperata TaxID=1284658 RepID=UPI003C70B71C